MSAVLNKFFVAYQNPQYTDQMRKLKIAPTLKALGIDKVHV